MSVRCFDLLFPPGSLEGGKGTNARWIQSLSLARETRHVLIGSFLIPQGAPVLDDWWVVQNLHFPSGQPGYEKINPSPIQIDVSNGATKIPTRGGGTLDTNTASPSYHQYLGTEKHVFPVDGPPGGPEWTNWANNPPNIIGTWCDWVLDCYLKENTGWFDFYVNGALFASSKTDHPAGISTIYTGLPNVEAWLGTYYPTRPDDGPENIGKTGHIQVALTRHGNDPASALADVPQLYVDPQGKIGWGALQLDLSVVTELPARDPASWVLPAALFSSSPPPVVVPYTVTDTLPTTAQGTITWIATPSDVARTAKLEFFVDGALQMGRAETTSPYGCSNIASSNSDLGQFDTTLIADGARSFVTRATATDGTVVSKTTSVLVDNAVVVVPPPPVVTPPPVTPPPVSTADLRTQLTSALNAAQDDFTASDAAMTVARKSLADCYQQYLECNARVDAISAALSRLP